MCRWRRRKGRSTPRSGGTPRPTRSTTDMRRILILLALVCATAAYAKGGSLSVSPAVIMLRGEAGQSTTQRMLLTNGTSRPFSFELIAKDVVVRNGKRFLVPAGETEGSIEIGRAHV